MRTVLSVVNSVCKLIAWGVALFLGFLISILVVTAMSIAYSINQCAGLGFLGFILLIVWMMFYAVKD